jgi:hypothetical protein
MGWLKDLGRGIANAGNQLNSITPRFDTRRGGAAGAIGSIVNAGLRSPGNSIKQTGNLISSAANLGSKHKDPGAPAPAPAAPSGISPHQSQIDYAKQFEKDLPGLENKLMGNLGSQVGEQMGAQIQSTRENASSRGLLHSGLRQGAEQSVRAKASTTLGQGRQALGQALRDQSKSLKDQAVQSGLDVQRSSQQMADIAYQDALASMANKNAGISGLMGAGGAILGGIYGGAGGAAAGGYAGSKIGKSL